MSRMLGMLWLMLVCVCLCSGELQAEQRVLTLSADKLRLAPYADFWRDESGQLGLQDVLTRSDRFRPVQDYPNWGFDPSAAYWFRIRLDNPGGQTLSRILFLDFPLLDHVTLYQPDGHGGFTGQTSGDTEAWSVRALKIRQVALPLQIPPETTADYYVRIASSSNIIFPAWLYSEDEFWADMSRLQLWQGVFYGAMLLLMLYSFFLFLTAREPLFFYFLLALLPTVAYLFCIDGLVFQFLPYPGFWQNLSLSYAIGLADILYLYFAQRYLKLPSGSVWTLCSRSLMALCLVCLMLLPVLGPTSGAMAVLLLGALVGAFIMAMGLAALSREGTVALYFVLGWFIFLINAIAAVLAAFALVPFLDFFLVGIKIGLVCAMVLLFMGLGLQLRRLKEAEAQSREAAVLAQAQSQAKSQFLAMMSHEIRTPMNGVLGMAELLRTTGLNAEQNRILSTMESSGNALLDVINDVLDHAKIEAGRMQLDMAPLDVDELLDDCLDLFRARIYKQQLSLLCSITRDVPAEIMGDALRLRQVLTNLLSNAIKFTTHGGIEVALSLENSAGGTLLVIAVSDTGIGVPTDQHEQIFESFVQADVSTSRQYGGTGLGLSISRQLCRLMGGDLVLGEADGRGAVFRASVSLQRLIGARERFVWPADVAPVRLLLVDGDERFNTVMTSEASCTGFEVSAVPTGEAALAALKLAAEKGQPFVLIATALQLPDMNGLTLHARLQADSRLPRCQTLLFASPQMQPSPGVLVHAGVAHAFERPVLARELRQAALSVLRNVPSDTAIKPEQLPQYAGLRVLVAEDNRTNQIVAQGLLRRFGIQPEVVDNGQQAVALFSRRADFHLVLMDCEMPVMDGYVATRELRRLEQAEGRVRTPVLAVSAHVTQHHIDNCYAAGMDDHVAKPISLRVLADKLAQWSPITPSV